MFRYLRTKERMMISKYNEMGITYLKVSKGIYIPWMYLPCLFLQIFKTIPYETH